MDLRQIMYFMAVFEEKSFTRAAQKAGVVQPALSIQVKRLEDEFGVSLFERGPRGVAPTSFGKSFYQLCEPIRRDVAQARNMMVALAGSGQISGLLRCGFPPTFFKAIVGPVVADLLAIHPRVELHLREGYGRILSEWVLKGELDFALGAWSLDMPGLDHAMVHEEDVVLVCGAPLAQPPYSECDLSALNGRKLMLPSGNQILGPPLAQYITSGRIKPAQTMTVDSYLGVIEIARHSDWAAFVPMTGVLDEMNEGGLHIYPIARPLLSFRWHVVHREGEELSGAGRAFVSMLSTALEDKKKRFHDLIGAQSVRAPRKRRGRNSAAL